MSNICMCGRTDVPDDRHRMLVTGDGGWFEWDTECPNNCGSVPCLKDEDGNIWSLNHIFERQADDTPAESQLPDHQ